MTCLLEREELLLVEHGCRQARIFGLTTGLLYILEKLRCFHFYIVRKSCARIILNTYNKMMGIK